MVTLKPTKGKLLIAEPSLTGDVSFNRSVVLLAEHSTEGSVGFILNKPLEYQINDLVTEIELPFLVYNGGPVEQDNLYFIHKVPHLIDNSVEISDGITPEAEPLQLDAVAQNFSNTSLSNEKLSQFLVGVN